MEKNGKMVKMDFTEGPIFSTLLRFALPFFLASLLNNLYNTVDMIVIGHFAGNAGTAAVTIGGKLLNVFTMVGMGFSSAGQIYIAQCVGAKKNREISMTLGTLFSVLFLAAVLIATGTLMCSGRIMTWLNTPEESYDGALAYMRITCFGLPLIYGYEVVGAALRGMGNSRAPLAFVAVATVVNLILDVIFVAVLQMGAEGTALATVIGQGVSLVISVMYLYKNRHGFGLEMNGRMLKPDTHILKILLRLGIPMAASYGLVQGSQIIMVSFVNCYGVVQIAAYGIGEKVLTLANVFISSVTTSAGAMMGQNIGARKYDRVSRLVKNTLTIGLLLAVALACVCLISPRGIFRIFTSDEQVLDYAEEFVQMSVLLFFLSAVQGGYQSVVTATGNTKLSLLASTIDSVILRIGLGLLFGVCWGMEVSGIFLGTVLARLGPITVGMIYFYSNRWKTRTELVN